jgi:hypothetical protein
MAVEGTTGRPLRALRAALFAALCVTLSATSHILLSRSPLPLTTVAGALAGVFAVAYGLGGRERGYWAIAALLVPLELAADTLFTTGQHTCYGPGGGPVTGSWRSLNEALTCHGGSAGGSLATTALPGTGNAVANPWVLLTVHVTVGLFASWVLRRGEAWLHRVLRAAFRPLLVAVAALAALYGENRPSRRPTTPRRTPARAAPALPLLLHSVVRRGPPCPAAL